MRPGDPQQTSSTAAARRAPSRLVQSRGFGARSRWFGNHFGYAKGGHFGRMGGGRFNRPGRGRWNVGWSARPYGNGYHASFRIRSPGGRHYHLFRGPRVPL